MAVSNYQDLIVWQKSMELAKSVYAVVNYLLKEEMSCFLKIAKGSAAELETQLLLCLNIGYLKQQDLEPLFSLLDEVSKMLKSLLRPVNCGSRKRRSYPANSELVTRN